MLPGATVFVTSKPTALGILSKLNFDRTVEIIGFTPAKIEKYVKTFCANNNKEDLEIKLWNHIKSSLELKNLCYIPVNCFIVCVSLFVTVYEVALYYCKNYHDRNQNKECYEKVLKGLQHLAFYGMKNDILVFSGQLVDEQIKESGLLNCLPKPIFQIQTQVCFLHLTVQEFLAAQHIVETKEPEDIEEFISSHVKNGKWNLVLQFLAGLLGKKMKISNAYKRCVLAFTEHLKGGGHPTHFGCLYNTTERLALKCLRETGEEDIARKTAATSALKDLKRIELRGRFISPMVFVCKHLKSLTEIHYSEITLNLDCLMDVTKLLQERCIKTLRLNCEIDDFGLKHVLIALTESECHVNHEHTALTTLKLDANKITDAGVFYLTEFMKNGRGRCLKNLHLENNKITTCGVSKLCEVLDNQVSCHQLTALHIGRNAISDEGVNILCIALRNKQVKLKRLDLRYCSLTTKCISWLAEVLSDEYCEITDFSLQGDNIGDEGAAMLCCTLRKTHCKLTKLNIFDCSLTDQCMPSLIGALGDDRCRLTVLNISYNAFTDKHLSLLSHTIKLQHCCLRCLLVFGNCITKEGIRLLKDLESFEYCKARGFNVMSAL